VAECDLVPDCPAFLLLLLLLLLLELVLVGVVTMSCDCCMARLVSRTRRGDLTVGRRDPPVTPGVDLRDPSSPGGGMLTSSSVRCAFSVLARFFWGEGAPEEAVAAVECSVSSCPCCFLFFCGEACIQKH
jgi:hypothetical protein